MGLSGSKTKQTNAPTEFNKPYIQAGTTALGGAYEQAQPIVNAFTSSISQQLPGMATKAFGPNSTIDPATSYNSSVLDGDYLGQGNPWIKDILAQTSDVVGNRVNSSFGMAGRTGSSANQYALSKGLADSANNLQYSDYSAERGRMDAAASRAPSLNAAGFDALGAYISAAQAGAGLPGNVAGSYSNGLGGLVGQYNQSSTTTSKSLGQALQEMAIAASQTIRRQ